MSEVISFRLNKDNLREAKAILILQERRLKGFSIRQTITEALLKLDRNSIKSEDVTIDDFNATLSQINLLLRQIEGGNFLSSKVEINHPKHNELSTSFIASVKKAAKTGLELQ